MALCGSQKPNLVLQFSAFSIQASDFVRLLDELELGLSPTLPEQGNLILGGIGSFRDRLTDDLLALDLLLSGFREPRIVRHRARRCRREPARSRYFCDELAGRTSTDRCRNDEHRGWDDSIIIGVAGAEAWWPTNFRSGPLQTARGELRRRSYDPGCEDGV